MKTTRKTSVSETGHNKNVANFSSVIQILEESIYQIKVNGEMWKAQSESF